MQQQRSAIWLLPLPLALLASAPRPGCGRLPAIPFEIVDNIDTCGWPWAGWTAETLPAHFGITSRTAAQTIGQWCSTAGCNDSTIAALARTNACAGSTLGLIPSAFPSISDAAVNSSGHYNHACEAAADCINGGVPQSANLTAQLSILENYVHLWIPDKDWSGLGQVDFELWTPIWEENTGPGGYHSRRYQDLSITLARKQHPNASNDVVLAVAKREFEQAALNWMVGVLDKLHALRPRAKWGYYGAHPMRQ
jgi:hypothetical protein